MGTQKQESLEERTEKETHGAFVKRIVKNPRFYWAIGKFALAMSLPRIPESSAWVNIYLGAMSSNPEFLVGAMGLLPIDIDNYHDKECKAWKRLIRGYLPLEIEIPRAIYHLIKNKL